jgi:hypothetical protein
MREVKSQSLERHAL